MKFSFFHTRHSASCLVRTLGLDCFASRFFFLARFCVPALRRESAPEEAKRASHAKARFFASALRFFCCCYTHLQKINQNRVHRRCMVVVSPWRRAVLCLRHFLRTPPLPELSSGGQSLTSRGFVLNLGSLQILMALIYWDTPVLQWECHKTEQALREQMLKHSIIQIIPCNSGM